jgi:hypothetical protein
VPSVISTKQQLSLRNREKSRDLWSDTERGVRYCNTDEFVIKFVFSCSGGSFRVVFRDHHAVGCLADFR